MMALLVLALLCLVRAGESGRTGWLLGAAAALGIAFNVKLLESIVALPGLALLAYLGLPGSRRAHLASCSWRAPCTSPCRSSWLTATLMSPPTNAPMHSARATAARGMRPSSTTASNDSRGKPKPGGEPGFSSSPPYPVATQAERDRIPIVPPSATRLLDAYRAALRRAPGSRGPRRAAARRGRLSALLPAGSPTSSAGDAPTGSQALATAVARPPRALAWSPRQARPPPGSRPRPSPQHWAPPTRGPGPAEAEGRGAPAARRHGRPDAVAADRASSSSARWGGFTRATPKASRPRSPPALASASPGRPPAARPVACCRSAVTVLVVVLYAEHLLYGTTPVWWVTLAGAFGALALTGAAVLTAGRVPGLGAGVLAVHAHRAAGDPAVGVAASGQAKTPPTPIRSACWSRASSTR